MGSEGLIHKIEPFDTNYQYIPGLKRCGNDECTSSNHIPNVLTEDTSFCPDPSITTSYDRDVDNVEEAIRVLNDTIGSTERHWAYAAFYELEGWTEANATEIKGVRCLFPAPPQHLLAGSMWDTH